MQGFNMGRYYPPPSSDDAAPRFNTTRTLPKQPTVRFALPMAVWCETCAARAGPGAAPTLIPAGVRFDAVKTRVGAYHSTPVWEFAVRHFCGGTVRIRTDPARTRYVVAAGGRARDYGAPEVREMEGGLPVLSEEERERRRSDAMAALEGKKEERVVLGERAERLELLRRESERKWADPYELNRKLRRGARVERKKAVEREAEREGIQERFGLGVEVLDEVEGDVVRAKGVEFGVVGEEEGMRRVLGRGLFEADEAVEEKDEEKRKTERETRRKGKLKKQHEREKAFAALRRSLARNTRLATDPFLDHDRRVSGKLNLGIKRKRNEETEAEATEEGSSSSRPPDTPPAPPPPAAHATPVATVTVASSSPAPPAAPATALPGLLGAYASDSD